MIRLIPLEKGEQLNALLNEHALSYDETVHGYISADSSLNAHCVFSLNKYEVELLAIRFDCDDPLIPELLLRAVASYAAGRSGYIFSIDRSLAASFLPTLNALHFEQKQEKYIGKVPKILEGSCHCKN